MTNDERLQRAVDALGFSLQFETVDEDVYTIFNNGEWVAAGTASELLDTLSRRIFPPAAGGKTRRIVSETGVAFANATKPAPRVKDPTPPDGYFRRILYCGNQEIVACDGLCHKAWGIGSRPKIEHDDWDDQTWLADGELETAPRDPGTYEGGEGKHTGSLNKWCVCECERSTLTVDAEGFARLTDWSKRVHNDPARGENATITVHLSWFKEVF